MSIAGMQVEDAEPSYKGKAKSGKAKSGKGMVSITKGDMDGLVGAFCTAAGAISNAFWSNGGKNAAEPDAYPKAACDAAYSEAYAALTGAYNYPDLVLFKPTISTAPNTFRPMLGGALSYFIGTDCLQMSGRPEDQFPAGNDGTTFREYGFALGNYNPGAQGWSDCKWRPNNYHAGGRTGAAQGQIDFYKTEGGILTVDKTFTFGLNGGTKVITGHHSSLAVDKAGSSQYVPPPGPGFCGQTVFFLRSDLGSSYRAFQHGPIKYGTVECNSINQCVGDILVYEPIPVYGDRELTEKVGVYMSTQTMISISDDHFITLGNFVLEFDDGKKSELVFSGELNLEESGVKTGQGDFPITGGVGAYLGVKGEIEIHRDIDATIVDIEIRCL